MSRLPEVLDLMADADVDVMLLGREANARVVADTARLWLAGTRAFAPGCVVVRATGRVHVLANSEHLVPAGFPRDQMYGITWNPQRLFGGLTAIPGVAGARRVAVDGMTPGMHTLLTNALPGIDYVDAAALLADLWRRPEAIAADAVERAARVAESGMQAIVARLNPDVRLRALRGLAAFAFAEHGVTTPAFEAVVAPLDGTSSTWLAPDRALVDGERVAVRVGALAHGWEASLARTFVVGSPPHLSSPPPNWEALVAACMPGVTVGGLRRRAVVVYGAGRGVEPWDDDVELVPGLMCALELADERGVHQDVLRITDDGPVVVTRFA
ncbi:MAG TPA: M24 family metallopeptidase [Acidimicrobiia bacterium]|nr:M24 family metallopeptidase [Acidimicrobiia bacterium]